MCSAVTYTYRVPHVASPERECTPPREEGARARARACDEYAGSAFLLLQVRKQLPVVLTSKVVLT